MTHGSESRKEAVMPMLPYSFMRLACVFCVHGVAAFPGLSESLSTTSQLRNSPFHPFYFRYLGEA